jgi:multiple sugar transport system substrate-binding protein
MLLDTGRVIFSSGNAIYHRNWNYAYGTSQANPKLVGKVGVVTTPHFPGHASATCAGGWQYVVNQYSHNLDAATKFALWMGSAQGQLFKTLHTPWSPAYMPTNTNPQVLKKFPSYNILAQQALTERARPKTPFWTNMSTAAEAEITNALIGKKSAQQALKDANGKIEAILAGA